MVSKAWIAIWGRLPGSTIRVSIEAQGTCGAGDTNRILPARHYMFIRTTLPPPVFPSKVKKLARGASRTPNAFKISCASIPPTTAQMGENSCIAVVTIVLSRYSRLQHQNKRKHSLNEFSRDRGECISIDFRFGNQSVRCHLKFISIYGVIWEMALVNTLKLPQSYRIQWISTTGPKK